MNSEGIEMQTFQGLQSLVKRLRSPGGCPWDQEQTHSSIRRNLLEETYEVLEAIDGGDPKALCEELGDILAGNPMRDIEEYKVIALGELTE